jgi:hypothetical protein
MLEDSLREEAPEFFALPIDYSQREKDPRQCREAANQSVMVWLSEVMRGALH